MSSHEGMVFFRKPLGITHAQLHPQLMKIPRPSPCYLPFARWMSAVVCFAPALLSAHPGHYHPDETDEFDFLRATYLHSHGALDYVLAAIIISCIALACYNSKPAIRISAGALALGALAMLPII